MAITLAYIEKLSVSERIELIGKIWDSIEASSEKIELTQAQKEELDRRLSDIEANPNKGVSWEDVKAQMTPQLKNEAQDHADAVEGIRRGLEASDAGRVRPAEMVFTDMRAKIANAVEPAED